MCRKAQDVGPRPTVSRNPSVTTMSPSEWEKNVLSPSWNAPSGTVGVWVFLQLSLALESGRSDPVLPLQSVFLLETFQWLDMNPNHGISMLRLASQQKVMEATALATSVSTYLEASRHKHCLPRDSIWDGRALTVFLHCGVFHVQRCTACGRDDRRREGWKEGGRKRRREYVFLGLLFINHHTPSPSPITIHQCGFMWRLCSWLRSGSSGMPCTRARSVQVLPRVPDSLSPPCFCLLSNMLVFLITHISAPFLLPCLVVGWR